MNLYDRTPKSDTITITLKDPETQEVLKNADDTPMTITLWAPHTREYKAALYDIRSGATEEVKGKELLDSMTEVYATVTKEWNITLEGDQKAKLSYKKALEAYKKVYWIEDQLQSDLSEYEAFTPA